MSSSNNTTNAKNALDATLKTFVSGFAAHLSEYMKEKDTEISVEDICAAFDAPLKTSNMGSLSGNGSVGTVLPTTMPNYFNGSTPPAKKTGGRKKASDPNAPRCEYKTIRGNNPGKPCDKPCAGGDVLGGDRFCKGCLGKTSVKSKLEGGTSKPTVKPPTMPGSSVSAPKSEPSGDAQLSVEPVEGRAGYFREQNHGFIVKTDDDDTIVVYGIDPDGSGERKMTESEKNTARGMGLAIAVVEEEDEDEEKENVAPPSPVKKSTVKKTGVALPKV